MNRHCKTAITAAVLLCFFATSLSAAESLSRARLEKVGDFIKANVASEAIPGAVIRIVHKGKVVYEAAWGKRDPSTNTPMTLDSIFRIYSMTKPITIQDLMRHTAGLAYEFVDNKRVKQSYAEAKLFDSNVDNAEFVDRIAKLPLAFQPGTTWNYSHATDVLGRVIELVSGKTLFQFENERILSPLGMRDTGFYVTDESKRHRIAEPFPNQRNIRGEVEMNDPRIAAKWESGGHGMVSTVADYSKFLQMLRNGGVLNGKRILGKKTIAYMTANHIGPAAHVVGEPWPGFSFGLGFAVRTEAGVADQNGSVGEYTWNGGAGTYFWVDPKEDLFVVFMIQAPGQGWRCGAALHNIIYGAF